jgi:hypothetical protein
VSDGLIYVLEVVSVKHGTDEYEIRGQLLKESEPQSVVAFHLEEYSYHKEII